METLLNLLKGIAPALATAVAGPLGGLAVTALAEKFGVADEVNAVATAIAADPNAAQKLADLELEYAKLDSADRADARAMQIEAIHSDDQFVRRFVYYFITAWTCFSMVFIPAIVFGSVPEANVRFADTIIGFMLGTMIAAMFSFLLGSSLGSKTKSDALAKGRK